MKKIMAALLIFTASASRAKIVTVCASGCDATTLAGAMTLFDSGDTVRVTDSRTYNEQITPTGKFYFESVVGQHPTVGLIGSDAGFIIIDGCSKVVIDGKDGGLVLRSNTGGAGIKHNYTGSAVNNPTLIVKHTTFAVGADSDVGAFLLSDTGGNFTFDSCLFYQPNVSGSSQGGIYFEPDSGSDGTPLSLTVKNCLFYGFTVGKAIVTHPYLAAGPAPITTLATTLLNNTFVGCSYGVHGFDVANLIKMTNNIFYSNTAGDISGTPPTNTALITYNIFGTTPCSVFSSATNICSVTVTFVDAVNHDYRLKSNSRGVNEGISDGVKVDFYNTARPQGSAWDIGYYEYFTPPSISATKTASPTRTVTPTMTATKTASPTPTRSTTFTPIPNTTPRTYTPSYTLTPSPFIIMGNPRWKWNYKPVIGEGSRPVVSFAISVHHEPAAVRLERDGWVRWSATATVSATLTATPTATPTVTKTATPTASPTRTATPTRTP